MKSRTTFLDLLITGTKTGFPCFSQTLPFHPRFCELTNFQNLLTFVSFGSSRIQDSTVQYLTEAEQMTFGSSYWELQKIEGLRKGIRPCILCQPNGLNGLLGFSHLIFCSDFVFEQLSCLRVHTLNNVRMLYFLRFTKEIFRLRTEDISELQQKEGMLNIKALAREHSLVCTISFSFFTYIILINQGLSNCKKIL